MVDNASLAERIETARAAVAALSGDGREGALTLGRLADLLYERYEQTAEQLALAEALSLYREALARVPEPGLRRAQLLGSYGLALQDLHLLSGSCASLDAAIEADREALELTPKDVLHLIRNSFRYASKADWAELARDLRPVYSAPTEAAARSALDELAGKWGDRYPAIIKLWQNAWPEFVPFLAYSSEIRKVIYSTNAIESLHARFRRAVRVRGHFPNEQAALKCLYLTIRSLDPTGRGRARWITRWKAALNAFAVTFEGRIDFNDKQQEQRHLHR